MAAVLVLVFAHLWVISLCKDTLTAKPGEDTILPCQCDQDCVITLLEWSRVDKASDKFVLYFRDKMRPNYQLPSYRDRVELRDPEMKNGDVSVILKTVTVNDTGIYECRIGGKKTGRAKRNTPKVISTIKLEVADSGGGIIHGHSGLLASVGLAACVVIVGVLGFTVRKKFMGKNSEQPAAVEPGEQDPLENLKSKKDECHLNVTPSEN